MASTAVEAMTQKSPSSPDEASAASQASKLSYAAAALPETHKADKPVSSPPVQNDVKESKPDVKPLKIAKESKDSKAQPEKCDKPQPAETEDKEIPSSEKPACEPADDSVLKDSAQSPDEKVIEFVEAPPPKTNPWAKSGGTQNSTPPEPVPTVSGN